MCTVTWCRDTGRYHLFFNRDEKRARLPALPPEIQSTSSGIRFIAPIDGDLGGTWLLVNEYGVSIGILNHYEADTRFEPADPVTRGRLPFSLAESVSVKDVAASLSTLSLPRYRPFHLFAIDLDNSLYQWTWSGPPLPIASHGQVSPPLTSSSFESTAVCSARRRSFRALPAPFSPELLDGYHRCQEPGREAYSVNMARPDARTVSISHVSVSMEEISYSYTPMPEQADQHLSSSELSIERIAPPQS
ncbi:MAG: hypothetical protein AAGA96_00715 [Verrucomicrobiota bacterium]